MLNLDPFFNSRQAAKFYCEMECSFSALDAAQIIGWSNRPLNEKHKAYQRLMAEYANIDIKESGFPDLFSYLRACIQGERAAVEFYSHPSAAALYAYEFVQPLWMLQKNHMPLSEVYFAQLFSSPEKVIKAANIQYNDHKDDFALGRNELKLCIVKLTADTDNERVMVYTDMDGNVISVNEVTTELPATRGLLERCFFTRVLHDTALPIPFKKGDIVSSPGVAPEVYVVDKSRDLWIVWGCETTADDGFAAMEPAAPLWAYRPFEGPLKHRRRLLWYLSQYFKGALTLDDFFQYKTSVLDPAGYGGNRDEKDAVIWVRQKGIV